MASKGQARRSAQPNVTRTRGQLFEPNVAIFPYILSRNIKLWVSFIPPRQRSLLLAGLRFFETRHKNGHTASCERPGLRRHGPGPPKEQPLIHAPLYTKKHVGIRVLPTRTHQRAHTSSGNLTRCGRVFKGQARSRSTRAALSLFGLPYGGLTRCARVFKGQARSRSTRAALSLFALQC